VNEITLLQTIKTTLIAAVWPTTSNVVFPTGSVIIAVDNQNTLDYAIKHLRSPIAIISPGAGQSDPIYDEQPDFAYLEVSVKLVVHTPGDPVGENTLLGANLTGGANKSEGKGILTLEQNLYNAIGKLVEATVVIQFRQKGVVGGESLPNGSYIEYRDYRFEMIGTLV
jgi:hypothetical protein